MATSGIIVGGILLLIIAVIGYVIPVNDVDMAGNSVSTRIPNAVAACDSDMGQMAQAYRADVAQSCSMYTLMVMGVYGSGILGIVLIAVGAAKSGKKEDDQPLEDETSMKILKERFAKGEITKEEFDKMKKDLE